MNQGTDSDEYTSNRRAGHGTNGDRPTEKEIQRNLSLLLSTPLYSESEIIFCIP